MSVQHLSETLPSTLLAAHPDMELLDLRIILHLIFFSITATLFSAMAAPVHIPTNNAQMLQIISCFPVLVISGGLMEGRASWI